MTELIKVEQLKRCTKCELELPLNKFTKDRTKKDGFYSNCKDCRKKNYNHDYHKQYRQENKQQHNLLQKKWYLNNPNYYKEKAKKWKLNNPDKNRQYQITYYNKNKDRFNSRTTFSFFISSYGIKEVILKHQKKQCLICNKKFNQKNKWNKSNIDHWIPVAKNGEHSLDNVAIICYECNIAKLDKMPELFLKDRYDIINKKRLEIIELTKKELISNGIDWKFEYKKSDETM